MWRTYVRPRSLSGKYRIRGWDSPGRAESETWKEPHLFTPWGFGSVCLYVWGRVLGSGTGQTRALSSWGITFSSKENIYQVFNLCWVFQRRRARCSISRCTNMSPASAGSRAEREELRGRLRGRKGHSIFEVKNAKLAGAEGRWEGSRRLGRWAGPANTRPQRLVQKPPGFCLKSNGPTGKSFQ